MANSKDGEKHRTAHDRGRTGVTVKKGDGKTTLPVRAGGEAAVGPFLVPQAHGGALLSGGKPSGAQSGFPGIFWN